MTDVLKLATYFMKAAEEDVRRINLYDINLNESGLRDESLEFLKPYFEGKNNYLKLKEHLESDHPHLKNDHIRIGLSNDEKPWVINGRHRLLISKSIGIKEVPAILTEYDEEGYTTEEDVIIEL